MRARHFAKKLACLGMTIRQQFSRYARDKDFHFELMGALTFAFMLGVALRLAMRLHDRPLAAVISIGGYVLLFWLLQMIGIRHSRRVIPGSPQGARAEQGQEKLHIDHRAAAGKPPPDATRSD